MLGLGKHSVHTESNACAAEAPRTEAGEGLPPGKSGSLVSKWSGARAARGWPRAAHAEHQFSEGCFVHWLSRACEM